MKIAIIGGAGKMGIWFVRYFKSMNIPVIISDERLNEAYGVAELENVEIAKSNSDAVQGVDAAIVCVPIKKNKEVILEIAPYLNEGAILAEISSIKGGVLKTLKEAGSMGLKPLSIHPLFGPTADKLEGNTIIVVPVDNEEKEIKIAKTLFKKAKIVVSETEEHDRLMAVVLSLTYFMNLVLSQVISKEDLILLKKLSGTTFTVQLAIAESIVNENTNMILSLLKENEFTENYIDNFISCAKKIQNLIKKDPDEFKDFHYSLKSFMEVDPDYKLAGERRFKAFNALKQ